MGNKVLQDAKVALETLDVEKMLSVYGDQFLLEDLSSSRSITDKAALRSYFRNLFSLPDVAFTDIVIQQADAFAVVEWTWSGSTPSMDTLYRIRGASVLTLKGGRIVRETLYYDPRPALS